MTPKVPTSESGTEMLGITVAHTLRKNTKITITTRNRQQQSKLNILEPKRESFECGRR